jgi:hypothetical protein
MSVSFLTDQCTHQGIRRNGADELEVFGSAIAAFEFLTGEGDIDQTATEKRTARNNVDLQVLSGLEE